MNKYPKRIYVRISGKEIEHARAVSKACGMSVSELVRVLLQASNAANSAIVPSEKTTLIVIDALTAVKLQREMRRWGELKGNA